MNGQDRLCGSLKWVPQSRLCTIHLRVFMVVKELTCYSVLCSSGLDISDLGFVCTTVFSGANLCELGEMLLS